MRIEWKGFEISISVYQSVNTSVGVRQEINNKSSYLLSTDYCYCMSTCVYYCLIPESQTPKIRWTVGRWCHQFNHWGIVVGTRKNSRKNLVYSTVCHGPGVSCVCGQCPRNCSGALWRYYHTDSIQGVYLLYVCLYFVCVYVSLYCVVPCTVVLVHSSSFPHCMDNQYTHLTPVTPT